MITTTHTNQTWISKNPTSAKFATEHLALIERFTPKAEPKQCVLFQLVNFIKSL